MMTRRDALKVAAGATAAVLVPAAAGAAEDKKGFTLPKLPYAYDALEPHIDAKTMEIHHSKHHQAYVTNLNAALAAHPDWLAKPIDEVVGNLNQLPEAARTAVRNNGGGHYNHTLFWNVMSKGGGEPKGELAKALDVSFGGVDGFRKAMKDAALKQFGSGWAWLVVGKDKPLAIKSSPNQDSPRMVGEHPLLGVDVWEHAYYLKYQNKRADYVDAWFNVVNWDAVAEKFNAAKKA